MPERSDIAAVSETLAKRIKKNDLEVPMLPKVAGNVVRLTYDPDSSATAMANLIQSDQILAGNVMRVANSAAYSPSNSIVSLQQAIARLGMTTIAEIALSTCVNTGLFCTPGFESHIAYEIKYSLATGLWAKEVARACRKNVESAFLAGLLHDIGRPVAIQNTLEIAKQLNICLEKEDILSLEDLFQQQIGITVVTGWGLPKSVCESIEYFHDYTKNHGAQLQTMIVVAGAKIASHFICEESDDETCLTTEELISQNVFGDLNLYHDEIDALLTQEATIKSTLEAMSSG